MPDTLGFLVGLAALGAIGAGPALWLLAPGPRRVALALAIGPALGLVILGLLERLLIMWVGPVALWAVPVTIALLAVSAGAAALHWRRWRAEYAGLLQWQTGLPLAGLLLATLGALTAPLWLLGIQYTIFRSNSSDALVYMSLAESLRTVSWQTLLRGASFTTANLPNLAALSAVSPTALFTARFVSSTSVQNYPAVIAWGAQLTGLPVYRYYYVMGLSCFAAAVPLGWVIGSELKLPRLIWYLVGPAIALGFWARFVLERDAGYQIASIPALLLLVFAWIRLEAEPLAWLSPARILLSLSIAAILCFHPPVILVVALSFAVYYGLGLAQREVPPQSVLYHLLTGGLALAFLLVTGQFVAVLVTSATIGTVVQQVGTIEAEVIQLLRQDPIAAFWGLPRPWLVWPLPGAWSAIFRRVALLLGLAWFAALGALAAAVVLRRGSRAARAVLSVAAGGLALLLILWGLGNLRAADKAFTYVFPYLLLSAAGAAAQVPNFKRFNLQPIATGGLAALLLSQAAVGALLPFYAQVGGLFAVSAASKPESYDLSPIVTYLDQHPPRLLLVDVPRAKTWEFALYNMFVFERFPAHFQSGLVIDNNTTYRSLWLNPLQTAPDYALMLRDVDYVGPGQLGTAVAQTSDLVLYRLTQPDLALYQARDVAARALDQARPLFPTLAP